MIMHKFWPMWMRIFHKENLEAVIMKMVIIKNLITNVEHQTMNKVTGKCLQLSVGGMT